MIPDSLSGEDSSRAMMMPCSLTPGRRLYLCPDISHTALGLSSINFGYRTAYLVQDCALTLHALRRTIVRKV